MGCDTDTEDSLVDVSQSAQRKESGITSFVFLTDVRSISHWRPQAATELPGQRCRTTSLVWLPRRSYRCCIQSTLESRSASVQY